MDDPSTYFTPLRMSRPFAPGGAPAPGDGAALLTNLISWWELGEASGTTRLDSVVASANDLADPNTSVAQVAGKVGNAAGFTPTNWLVHADNASLKAGNIAFSIAAWVYLNAKAANIWIAGKDNGNNDEYGLYYNFATDRFAFYVGDGIGGISYILDANNFGSPSTATWYYLVGFFDPATPAASLQVNNGALDVDTTQGGNPPGTSTGGFRLGVIGDNTTWPLDGRVDQVAFAKRVWTPAERTWLYNSGNGRAFSELGP